MFLVVEKRKRYERKRVFLDDFISLFFDLMELLSLNQLNTFFIALSVWCIWKRRNDKQWKEVEIRLVINVTRDNLHQWMGCMNSKKGPKEVSVRG